MPVDEIIKSLKSKISMQLPEGLTFSDILSCDVKDDISYAPPHQQTQNSTCMNNNALMFKDLMLSSNEQQHLLILQEKIQEQLHVYLQHDYEIRGLIAALVATTTSVCLCPFQFKSNLIGADAKQQCNVCLLGG